MKEINHFQRILIQTLVLIVFFGLSILSFLPSLFGYALLEKIEFSNLMFYTGVGMGSFYDLLVFADSFYHRKARPKTWVNYLWSILPSSFLLSSFSWYFVLMANKMLSEDKVDAEFFQASMMAFTVFFLLVKIAKEIQNLQAKYKV